MIWALIGFLFGFLGIGLIILLQIMGVGYDQSFLYGGSVTIILALIFVLYVGKKWPNLFGPCISYREDGD